MDDFVFSHDPSQIIQIQQQVDNLFGREHRTTTLSKLPCQSQSGWRVLLQTISSPRCFSGTLSTIPLIVDTGASVCISPRREDFVTYKTSKVKIKDLSKTNTVQGEGLIRWTVRDKNGQNVILELPGYHIPNAEVRLLSPQVLLMTLGGQAIQTTAAYRINLDNGIDLVAQYCPRSNLPMLSCCDPNNSCFWNKIFDISQESTLAFAIHQNVLLQENTNLSASQKELLLWHQRLSHASVSWIQPLTRDRKWLKANPSTSLHQGPFIPSKESCTPTCDLKGLQCGACQMAKACTCSPLATHQSHDMPTR